MDKIDISEREIVFIKTLPDSDFINVLSEINDHGWEVTRKILTHIMVTKIGTK